MLSLMLPQFNSIAFSIDEAEIDTTTEVDAEESPSIPESEDKEENNQ